MLPALHVVNERLGYVPLEAVIEIAQMLGLAPAQVQDTLSFYHFFPQDKPSGKFKVWMCRSLSCSCCEGEVLMDYLAQKLGIQPGETSGDGRVTLLPAECLGACDFAPAMLVNDTLYKTMTREKIDAFVEMVRSEKIEMKVSNLKSQISNFKFQISNFKSQIPGPPTFDL